MTIGGLLMTEPIDPKKTKKPEAYLTPKKVSQRYGGTPAVQTLANWRSNTGGGPPFLRIGNKILYPLSRIEDWERRNTDDRDAPPAS
jgi:hypothetical protein